MKTINVRRVSNTLSENEMKNVIGGQKADPQLEAYADWGDPGSGGSGLIGGGGAFTCTSTGCSGSCYEGNTWKGWCKNTSLGCLCETRAS